MDLRLGRWQDVLAALLRTRTVERDEARCVAVALAELLDDVESFASVAGMTAAVTLQEMVPESWRPTT